MSQESEHEIMIEQHPIGVGGFIKRLVLVYTAGPNPEHIEARLGGRSHHTSVRSSGDPAIKLLHWNHVRTAGIDSHPVDAKEHGECTTSVAVLVCFSGLLGII